VRTGRPSAAKCCSSDRVRSGRKHNGPSTVLFLIPSFFLSFFMLITCLFYIGKAGVPYSRVAICWSLQLVLSLNRLETAPADRHVFARRVANCCLSLNIWRFLLHWINWLSDMIYVEFRTLHVSTNTQLQSSPKQHWCCS